MSFKPYHDLYIHIRQLLMFYDVNTKIDYRENEKRSTLCRNNDNPTIDIHIETCVVANVLAQHVGAQATCCESRARIFVI